MLFFRSSDLSLVNYFLQGEIKSIMSYRRVNSEMNLEARISVAAATNLEMPNIFEIVWKYMFRNLLVCKTANGRSFEHFLLFI